ncbi:MAG TPA: hypothetical protein VGI40_16470 [Pirellulaceae bacterium]|jgi:hypothetical protein
MKKLVVVALFGLVCGATLVGCGNSQTPKIETFQAPAPDPVARAKTILTNYANGMPVTSEVSSFDDIVAAVKTKDAAKGEILEKGFAAIKANPSTAKSKANELLKQL